MTSETTHPPIGYRHESSRPLTSLVFVTPMLLVYESSVWLLGPQAMRNGADVWMRHLLDRMGFGQYFLLPVLTCAILLAWHHTIADRWRLKWSVLGGMVLESVACAYALILLGQLQGTLLSSLSGVSTAAVAGTMSLPERASQTGQLIGYFGAGIYEELMFRLMLLPVSISLLRLCGLARRTSLVSAIVLTSLVFSAAHYEAFTAGGETFEWFSFCFRFLAGVCFSVLFVYRGFGIAAGSHALYDILAACL